MEFSGLFEAVANSGNFSIGVLGSVVGIFVIATILRRRSQPIQNHKDDPTRPSESDRDFEIGETDLNAGHPADDFEFSETDLGGGSSPGYESADPEPEPVECSTFSPSSVPAGKRFTVQVALHRPDDEDKVVAMAEEVDAETEPKFGMPLSESITIGQEIDMSVEVEGAERSDSGPRKVKWTGSPILEAFQFTPDEGAPVRLKASVRLFVDGIPVGSAKWAIKLSEDEQESGQTQTRLKRYRKIFVSYSSKDRTEVLKRVQMIEHSPDDYFMDLLNLTAGQRWEKALYENIQDCDAFYVFWSENSSASEWVIKELEHAAKLQKSGDDSRPDIVPIILDVPPPLPPDFVSDIHFNSMFAYIIAAHAAKDSAS